MNNVGFGKTMKKVRKHKDIEVAITKRRRNYLVSEQIIILQIFSQNIY